MIKADSQPLFRLVESLEGGINVYRDHASGILKTCARDFINKQWEVEYSSPALSGKVFVCWSDVRDALFALENNSN